MKLNDVICCPSCSSIKVDFLGAIERNRIIYHLFRCEECGKEVMVPQGEEFTDYDIYVRKRGSEGC